MQWAFTLFIVCETWVMPLEGWLIDRTGPRVFTSALKWFPDRRGLAAGIISGGFGSGAALFIPLIQHIIVTHNYHQAFLYTGVTQGLVIIGVAQVLRHPQVEQAGYLSPRQAPASRQFTTPGCFGRLIFTRSI